SILRRRRSGLFLMVFVARTTLPSYAFRSHSRSPFAHNAQLKERHNSATGLFPSVRAAEAVVENGKALDTCRFHFEQNSRDILGIQLADIVAHTCGTMLLDSLGHISKMIIVDEPSDSGYHGMEVELGFEMWAGIRYSFLSRNKTNPKDDFELANVDVFPWGLFIDDSVDEQIASAAKDRFGEMYLGCIH
ncbi:MAG: hypothetical protein QM488_11650, partial [Rhizobiaceae bacterium]